MHLREAADAAEFLALTGAVRAADPVRTNVLGSIATSVVEGRRYDEQHWYVVEDAAGSVVAGAVWTPPYRLLVGPMDDDAADAVGRHVAALPAAPPGVIGPEDVAARVAAAAGRATRPVMRERMLVLGDPVPAPAVPGAARPATADDIDLGTAWLQRFSDDSGSFIPDPRQSFLSRVGSSWFWEVDGVPVAYAAHSSMVVSPAGATARIGPVFTVAEHRRRGYGAAVTWAVVERLLPRAATVMLYTDADNPTSNGVYERLGFRAVAEVVELDLL